MDILIPSRSAGFMHLDAVNDKADGSPMIETPGMRVFRIDSEAVSIQIRANSVLENAGGKSTKRKRDLVATARMARPELLSLRGAIDLSIDDLAGTPKPLAQSEHGDRIALAERLCARLESVGYVIYSGNAETGETVDDGSGPDFWFTWTQGRDVETGETHHSFLDAAGDAMNHWFRNAVIDVDGRL